MADAPETDDLRQDLEQLRQDFAALREDIKNDASSQVRSGMHKAREGANSLCNEVEARPCVSLAAAFGVGLVLGRLVSR